MGRKSQVLVPTGAGSVQGESLSQSDDDTIRFQPQVGEKKTRTGLHVAVYFRK